MKQVEGDRFLSSRAPTHLDSSLLFPLSIFLLHPLTFSLPLSWFWDQNSLVISRFVFKLFEFWNRQFCLVNLIISNTPVPSPTSTRQTRQSCIKVTTIIHYNNVCEISPLMFNGQRCPKISFDLIALLLKRSWPPPAALNHFICSHLSNSIPAIPFSEGLKKLAKLARMGRISRIGGVGRIGRIKRLPWSI